MKYIITMLLFVSPLFAQSVPTPTVCHEHLIHSLSKANKVDISEMTALELMDKSTLSQKCWTVIPEEINEFSAISEMFETEALSRLARFIDRHGLMAKFAEEDMAEVNARKKRD